MSQANFTPISIYYSTTASAVPTAANLVPGELAINTNDGKLYYEDSSGVVRVLSSKATGSIGGATTEIQYNNAGSLAGNAGFTFDGTIVQVKLGNTATTQFRIAHSSAANFYADYTEKGDLTVGRSSWSSNVTTEFSTTSSTSTYTGNVAGGFSFKPRGSLAVTINGNGVLDIGTGAGAVGQIQFPSTQVASANANTLDDYEEGTWTPTDGSGAGLSLTVSNATYTKIGRMVYASAQVAYPVTANTSQAILASLPFAVGTVPGTGVPNTPVTSSSLQLQINVKSINNAEIDIYPTAAGVTNAQLSGVAFISFTLIYPST
jgi:hypothetical protein